MENSTAGMNRWAVFKGPKDTHLTDLSSELNTILAVFKKLISLWACILNDLVMYYKLYKP